MTSYILRRLLLIIPTLLGITLLVFIMVSLAPGGVSAGLRASGALREGAPSGMPQLAYLEERYGLDDPMLVQYARWLGRLSPIKFGALQPADQGVSIIPGYIGIAPPDLGFSFSRGAPVSHLIGRALPVTLLLNVIAFMITFAIAVPTGILAAARAGSWFDTASRGLFIALWSIPVVLAGVLAVGYLASDAHVGWFPASGLHDPDADAMAFLPAPRDDGSWQRGYLLDTIWHLCLPVACLTYGGFALLSRQTRAAMLDCMTADYIRTARAKGVPPQRILLHHAFRNSLLPLITIFAATFPALLSGSIVVEKIFSIPGMGSLIIDAINLRDREVLLANVVMIGAVNLFAMLLADILYAFADPRISYE